MKLDQNGLADSEMEVRTDIAPRHLEMKWITTGRGLEARWTWGTGLSQNFTLQIGPAAAVPEPSSFPLLGLLVVRMRRRDGTTG